MAKWITIVYVLVICVCRGVAYFTRRRIQVYDISLNSS
jgi:hypothetical protein